MNVGPITSLGVACPVRLSGCLNLGGKIFEETEDLVDGCLAEMLNRRVK